MKSYGDATSEGKRVKPSMKIRFAKVLLLLNLIGITFTFAQGITPRSQTPICEQGEGIGVYTTTCMSLDGVPQYKL